MPIIVKEFFDKDTWTLTYLVYDKLTLDAVVIDAVWDYDPASSKLSSASLVQIIDFIHTNSLKLHFILETHAHADHVSGSQVLKQHFKFAQIGIGSEITLVQKVFKKIFNLNAEFKTDGSQFDFLFHEDEIVKAGSLLIKTIFTPGHTPGCVSYVIGDCVFTGDALFMPDYGTGRCDFPSGNADDLYSSIMNKLYKLPDHFRVFVGHDYLPNGRALAFESSIGEEKLKNIHITNETKREKFVEFRRNRDKTLLQPRLLLPSVQININAGCLPETENNGMAYLKIPIRN